MPNDLTRCLHEWVQRITSGSVAHCRRPSSKNLTTPDALLLQCHSRIATYILIITDCQAAFCTQLQWPASASGHRVIDDSAPFTLAQAVKSLFSPARCLWMLSLSLAAQVDCSLWGVVGLMHLVVFESMRAEARIRFTSSAFLVSILTCPSCRALKLWIAIGHTGQVTTACPGFCTMRTAHRAAI